MSTPAREGIVYRGGETDTSLRGAGVTGLWFPSNPQESSMKVFALSCVLLLASAPVLAAKNCDELKTEIAAKLDAKKVTGYTLDIVANDQVAERKVVGSCEGGAKKIVYTREAKK